MAEVRTDLEGNDPGDPLQREFDALVSGIADDMPSWDQGLAAEAWGLVHDEIPHLLGKLSVRQGSDFVMRGIDTEGEVTQNLLEPFRIEDTGNMGWRVITQGEEKRDERGEYKPVVHYVTDAVSEADQDLDQPAAEPSNTWAGEEIRIRPVDGKYPALGEITTQFTFKEGKLHVDANEFAEEELDFLTTLPPSVEAAQKLATVLKGLNPMFASQITESRISTTLHKP